MSVVSLCLLVFYVTFLRHSIITLLRVYVTLQATSLQPEAIRLRFQSVVLRKNNEVALSKGWRCDLEITSGFKIITRKHQGENNRNQSTNSAFKRKLVTVVCIGTTCCCSNLLIDDVASDGVTHFPKFNSNDLSLL